MSFPRYPEYKDSGVEWLGEVPMHWDIVALKHLASMKSGSTPSKDNLDYWDGDIPWASAKDLKVDYLFDTADHITQDAVDAGASLVPAGSLLVVVRGMILAKVFPVVQTATPMAINQDLKALQPKSGLDSRYFSWLLRGAEKESMRRTDEAGHGTKALRMDIWSAMPLPVPAIDEQCVIATFLDRETAKIDGLMAEQDKLIELLKEKRQAVISQAVTKGLNSTVPMKGSGVEWFGEVPAHWEVSQLKHIAKDGTSITYGIVQAGPHIENGVPYIKTSDMSGDSLPVGGYSKTSLEISQAYSRSTVFFGDLVIAIRATVGKCLPLPKELDGANLTQGTAKISPNECIERDYLLHLINSAELQVYFDLMAKGATFKEITLEVLRRTPVLIPPLIEQRSIVRYLATELKAFQDLLQETQNAISLLKERRTALISAAVTGQIDVRGLVKDAQEQAA